MLAAIFAIDALVLHAITARRRPATSSDPASVATRVSDRIAQRTPIRV
jgi:hypothetical protein